MRRELLYTYCQDRGVTHRKSGELVVAPETSSVATVERVREQALACGVKDVVMMDQNQVSDIEPDLSCEAALLSPSSGIVDSHSLMKTFLREAEETGAILLLGTPFQAGRIQGGNIEIDIGGPDPVKTNCRVVINSAGIHAQSVARTITGLDPIFIPPSFLCRGSYFTSSADIPISHLIYSTPSQDGPGIHLSFDLAGQARFGPDAVWTDKIDYDIEPARAAHFEQGIRRYWPGIPENSLGPGFAGYFARTYGPDDPVKDWIIQGTEDHGIEGLINLFGIDSPGLTACMAIAEYVKDMLGIE